MKLLNLLHVEDSPDDYALITRHLTKAGYELYAERVETAEAMRAALSAQAWDIIISDYRMPHFSGLQAFAVLNESKQDIPFIIISGTIGEETAVEAMLTGVNDYMMKNNLGRLVPAIEREMQQLLHPFEVDQPGIGDRRIEYPKLMHTRAICEMGQPRIGDGGIAEVQLGHTRGCRAVRDVGQPGVGYLGAHQVKQPQPLAAFESGQVPVGHLLVLPQPDL